MEGTVITSAVCRKLHSIYPTISIYREHIDEDFDEPSFFVWTSSITTDAEMWPAWFETHHIEVTYFPLRGNTSMYEECLNIGIQLLEALSKIDVEIDNIKMPVWGINPSRQIVDDNMLVFSIEYRIKAVINEQPSVLMANIDVNVGEK